MFVGRINYLVEKHFFRVVFLKSLSQQLRVTDVDNFLAAVENQCLCLKFEGMFNCVILFSFVPASLSF